MQNNLLNNQGINRPINQGNGVSGQQTNVHTGINQDNIQQRTQHEARDLVENFTEHTGKKTHEENKIFDKETGKPIKWINLFKDTANRLANPQAAKTNLHRIVKDCHAHLKNIMNNGNVDDLQILDQKFYRWDTFMKFVRPIKSVEREKMGQTIGIQLGFVGAFDASICGMFFAQFANYLDTNYGIAFESNNWNLQSNVRKDQDGNEILTQKQFFLRRIESISQFNFLKERIGRVDDPKDREIWVMDNLPSIESSDENEE